MPSRKKPDHAKLASVCSLIPPQSSAPTLRSRAARRRPEVALAKLDDSLTRVETRLLRKKRSTNKNTDRTRYENERASFSRPIVSRAGVSAVYFRRATDQGDGAGLSTRCKRPTARPYPPQGTSQVARHHDIGAVKTVRTARPPASARPFSRPPAHRHSFACFCARDSPPALIARLLFYPAVFDAPAGPIRLAFAKPICREAPAARHRFAIHVSQYALVSR